MIAQDMACPDIAVEPAQVGQPVPGKSDRVTALPAIARHDQRSTGQQAFPHGLMAGAGDVGHVSQGDQPADGIGRGAYADSQAAAQPGFRLRIYDDAAAQLLQAFAEHRIVGP